MVVLSKTSNFEGHMKKEKWFFSPPNLFKLSFGIKT